jgi:hypothetical protein
MRCMACGAEMVLMNVVQDDTMAVPGFEHHTFTCSECQDVEERLVFTKQNRESDTEPMLEQAAPPVAPASTVQFEPVAASGLLSCPVEPDQTVSTVPAESTEPVQPTQTASLAPVQTAPEEPIIENHTPLSFQRNAWGKALVEKLHNLMERATTAREAANE